MKKKEAVAKLAELVKEAYSALHEAESFATEHKLGFNFSPAYGMGGYFDGDEVGETGDYGEEKDGWNPSSMSC